MPTGSLTDRSGSITTGGTAQTVAAANWQRTYFFFMNLSDTDMSLDFGASATADTALLLVSKGSVEFVAPGFVPGGLVSVLCASTGKKFACKEG